MTVTIIHKTGWGNRQKYIGVRGKMSRCEGVMSLQMKKKEIKGADKYLTKTEKRY